MQLKFFRILENYEDVLNFMYVEISLAVIIHRGTQRQTVSLLQYQSLASRAVN